MFDNDNNMNFLFYVGIIVPTLITVALFLVFIYCWFLQKARKEVLTKKYDPHGKMRSMGMSLDPPPPPAFCRLEDALLPDNGEDNVAYDVSRSPSTEQDGHGRPMYHTYHDSGISAGLSPSQESEPRPGLGYRTCPDSGISIFGPQPAHCSYHVSAGFCQAQEPIQRQPQQQQVYCDHMHAHQHQHQLHQPQAILHHNLVQASVHPTHGVCYGDDMNHSQSPQHYIPPVVHPASLNIANYNERQQIGIVAHVHKPPAQHALPNRQPRVPFCAESPGYQLQSQCDQQCHSASDTTERVQNISNHTPPGRQGQDTAAISTTADPQVPNRTIPCSGNFHLQYDLEPDNAGQQYPSSSSSPPKPFRHSYRDNSAVNNTQPTVSAADRPESQASHSSTTDSEDSGFRSSHCAAHHNAALSKQGNPLLKPLRRTKANKPKSKPPKTASPNAEASRTSSATPLITLNPHNLQMNVDNSNVIQNTSLMELDLVHRQSRIPQQNSNITNSISNDRVAMFPCTTPQGAVSSTFHDTSPTRAHQHSLARDNWPSQSTNDEETKVNQNIDLSEISTHLSWKYLHDLTSSNTTYNAGANGSIVIQPCHQGIRPGQILQNNHEQHMEMFGFSVV